MDISLVRSQFPFFSKNSNLVYLDNAATTQKPQCVLDTVHEALSCAGNALRGLHMPAEKATQYVEDARQTVQKFLCASFPSEIVFTHGCTEAINLVAHSIGSTLTAGDTIVLSVLEHHSNIVPWLQLKERNGIEIKWVDIDDSGQLRLDQFKEYLDTGTVKLIAVTGQSNVLGIVPLLSDIISLSHQAGAKVLIDAAQLIAHQPIDVHTLDCDFLVFSGHKLYGPTGVGVLFGKKEFLKTMPPFLGGGHMIQRVTQEEFISADSPHKFEAGTQPIVEIAGFNAAVSWLMQQDRVAVAQHEQEVSSHLYDALSSLSFVNILSPRESNCISVTVDQVHPHDSAHLLGDMGVCVRAGHHCAQPLHNTLGIVASLRFSVGLYNTKEEVDAAVSALEKIHHKLTQ